MTIGKMAYTKWRLLYFTLRVIPFLILRLLSTQGGESNVGNHV